MSNHITDNYSELDNKVEKKKCGVYIETTLIDHFKRVADELDTSFSAVTAHILRKQMEKDLRNEEEKKGGSDNE